jgi:hypothetical protein
MGEVRSTHETQEKHPFYKASQEEDSKSFSVIVIKQRAKYTRFREVTMLLFCLLSRVTEKNLHKISEPDQEAPESLPTQHFARQPCKYYSQQEIQKYEGRVASNSKFEGTVTVEHNQLQ